MHKRRESGMLVHCKLFVEGSHTWWSFEGLVSPVIQQLPSIRQVPDWAWLTYKEES
ncbi:hypothetical protein DPMN_180631 [Dreissena polymorpha]|uniref:Uncharacterized protein n=1 Tax=Dreissena polymorpha TaxID=45954 RepID=A0A9D4INF1_DREPO|nr:hypothetical protein DPMN_180631 [Dreissena polymorpha]